MTVTKLHWAAGTLAACGLALGVAWAAGPWNAPPPAGRPVAPAKEDDPEKLFLAMQQKVAAAKTVRVRFDLSVTDAAGKTGTVKGSLTLGEGDKYRAEGEGKLFGEAVKFTEVCDGVTTKSVGGPDPPAAAKSPKGAGAYLRRALPVEGFFLSSLNLDRRGDRPAAAFQAVDFKLGGKEKVAGRDAHVIRFTLPATLDGTGKERVPMTVWLDAETGLPARFAMTGGTSDVRDVTETYAEFALDPKVDAKVFELPKEKGKGPDPLPADKDDDTKRIQGTWVVDPATYKDIKDLEVLKEVLKAAESDRFIFAGDTFTLKHPPANEEKGGFRLDPTKKPKQIDLSDQAQGIYELDGDTLKLCWDQRGKDNGRPTTFAHDKDKDTVHYFVLKREKK